MLINIYKHDQTKIN